MSPNPGGLRSHNDPTFPLPFFERFDLSARPTGHVPRAEHTPRGAGCGGIRQLGGAPPRGSARTGDAPASKVYDSDLMTLRASLPGDSHHPRSAGPNGSVGSRRPSVAII